MNSHLEQEVEAPRAEKKISPSIFDVKKPSNTDSNRPSRVFAPLDSEEDPESKFVLIKINRQSKTNQTISYALKMIKDDWKVELTAFSMDIVKIMRVVEIIKSRFQYLYQENKLLSSKIEKEDGEIEVSGLSVTLSNNEFEVSDIVGYQKPKPRQFIQLPRRKVEEPAKQSEKKPVIKESNRGGQKRGSGKRKEYRRKVSSHSADNLKSHTITEEASVKNGKQKKQNHGRGG